MTIVQNVPVDLRSLLAARVTTSPYIEDMDEEDATPALSLPRLGDLFVTRSDTQEIFADAAEDWIVESAATGGWADFPDWEAYAVEHLRAAFWAELMNGKLVHDSDMVQGTADVLEAHWIELPALEAMGAVNAPAMQHVDGEGWTARFDANMDGASPAELRQVALQLLKLSFVGDLLIESETIS